MRTALKLWAVATALLYALLAYGSYVTLPSHAGGMLGFDMRPFGMSGAEGVAYLDALTEAGRRYYADWLKPLDTVFLISLTLLLMALARRQKGFLAVLAGIAALAYGCFDLVENTLVADMMMSRTETGQIQAIAQIAGITMAKFASLALAALLLLVGWRRRTAHA